MSLQRQLQLDNLHAVDAECEFRLQFLGGDGHRGGLAAPHVEDGQQLDLE